MRLRSDIFVSALVRQAFAAGGFAAIEKKGALEAGAIFLRQRHRTGLITLFGPAPQTAFDEGEAAGLRLFEKRLETEEPDEVLALLQREQKFDPDIWIVELELDDVADLVPLASSD